MSETDNQANAVLLPASSVAVFSRDTKTLKAARAVEGDWRFARVALHVEEGDVLSAIESFKTSDSPDLVIIQTEKIDDELPAQLEDLANHCDEGTGAIIVGPDNDVDLYRKLIDMGVSDYLVRPVETNFLADVMAKTLIDKVGVSGSRLIAFVGAKGGVGASALAQAAAWGIADSLEQKTMFVDIAGGWSTTAVGVGFEPSASLAEAVKAAEDDNEDDLNRMLHEASERLSVLATGGEVMLEQTVTDGQIETLLDMLMVKYPVVVVDLSHGAADLERAVIARANHIFLVTTPGLPALRLTRSLVQEIKDLRGGEAENMDLIVNMQGMAAGNEVSNKDIEEAMELKISASIPFAAKTFMGSESAGKKLSDDKDGAQIVSGKLLPLMRKTLALRKEDQSAVSADSGVGLFGSILAKLKK